MAFSYNGTLSTDLDKVRFYIQDTVSGSGPKPSDGNFTDDELSGLLTVEGCWQRAVAAAYEALATAWRKHVTFQADGLRMDRSDVADGYAEQAKLWRVKYGGAGATTTTGKAGSRAVTRVDGYSDDIDNQEV